MRTRIQRMPPLALAVAGIAILAGCHGNEGAAPSAAAPEVGVVTIQPASTTLTTELPGRVSATLVAEVRPQVSGIVQKRLFAEGSEVKAGDVLYQIDAASYQAAYDNARGAVAKSRASLATAKLKAQRYKALLDIKGVSQQDYDDAKASLDAYEAEVISNEAALQSARIDLQRTRVTSPITGRIGRSSVTAGALVTASQTTALATVQQLDTVYVDVVQSSAELLRLRRRLAEGTLQHGAADVKLVLEDGSTYAQAGRLQFTEVSVEQSTGAVTLRATFANPRQQLLPGMYVRAVLQEGVEDKALLVPLKGVSRDSKGNPTVMVLDRDNRIHVRQVSTSRSAGGNWVVALGISAGDRVVVDGLQKVRDGMAVTPVAADVRPAAAPVVASHAQPGEAGRAE
ncbi:membrane fusion protein, multidrug efflux system [Ralstonia sp. 25mfcol4.1]|uniref:efflux RND transporter periplasmic adaptor subunit n=1 Tax=Ralstonia sp. 25mfcol4.1 TaxID=1761899 RepID=UPI0008925FD7|nr:efflux RND transporter periplasmic adaptor subunit [Ralstonia sp. 25mfcol4.1]SDP72765.1 membrane fusion protein, multidrug efflux system [Ralstonia sp. 25mfcol4.1]